MGNELICLGIIKLVVLRDNVLLRIVILDVQIVDDVEQDVLVLVRHGDPSQLPGLEYSSELVLLVLVAEFKMFFKSNGKLWPNLYF